MQGVTIGVPVYNEGKYLANTLASIDGQAERIIICDNASSDSTEEICREFASGRPYVQYHRFETNRGAGANFRACLELAGSRYFMWVGGHDMLEKNHVCNLLNTLLTHNAVMAYANPIHVDTEYRFMHSYYYDFHQYLIDERPEVRVWAVIKFVSDCSMYHGLYLRNALNAFFAEEDLKRLTDYVSMDFVSLAYTAMLGKMALAPQSHYIRLEPRTREDRVERWRRALAAIDPALPEDPYIIPRSVLKGQMDILKKLAVSPDVNKGVLDAAISELLKRWGPWQGEGRSDKKAGHNEPALA